MPNYLKLNKDAIHNYYKVDQLIQLAMEQNILISQSEPKKEFFINYTLKDLTAMSFEQWARLIEIENINNNDRN